MSENIKKAHDAEVAEARQGEENKNSFTGQKAITGLIIPFAPLRFGADMEGLTALGRVGLYGGLAYLFRKNARALTTFSVLTATALTSSIMANTYHPHTNAQTRVET